MLNRQCLEAFAVRVKTQILSFADQLIVVLGIQPRALCLSHLLTAELHPQPMVCLAEDAVLAASCLSFFLLHPSGYLPLCLSHTQVRAHSRERAIL